MTVSVRTCHDTSFIRSVLTDEEMWKRISEDDQQRDAFDLADVNDDWTFSEFLTVDGPIGLFVLHPMNQTTVMVHIHILEQFRALYAAAAGRALMEWMHCHLSERVCKVVAEIPVVFQDVYHYTKNHGFLDEGCNRKSILIDGELVDQKYLGITREEIGEWVQSQA